jgi:hypothetical protein
MFSALLIPVHAAQIAAVSVARSASDTLWTDQ